uniref:Uncharacterized protein n=1 Tax=viral metagenome TaxID=1070528 RepID=A0A6C0H7Y5_9ZZZZ
MHKNCKYEASGEYICPCASNKIEDNLKKKKSALEPITNDDNKWKLHNNHNKWINIIYSNCNGNKLYIK